MERNPLTEAEIGEFAARAKEEKRKNQFSDWWDGDYSDDRYIDLEQEDAVKLRAAFELVFNKMPNDDREAFIEESPKIICSDHYGMVIHFRVDRFPMTAIYLRHDLIHLDHCVDTIAHEMAHVVLGHHKEPIRNYERLADDRSESWGFKRCYTEPEF